MRAQFIFVLAAAMMLVVAGCSDNSSPNSSQDANSLPENRTPEIDADPTPDTGSGGDSQAKSPDTTTNGAPAAQ